LSLNTTIDINSANFKLLLSLDDMTWLDQHTIHFISERQWFWFRDDYNRFWFIRLFLLGVRFGLSAAAATGN
jgi:uncharacterized membrane protein YfbV (UPF0208 family)